METTTPDALRLAGAAERLADTLEAGVLVDLVDLGRLEAAAAAVYTVGADAATRAVVLRLRARTSALRDRAELFDFDGYAARRAAVELLLVDGAPRDLAADVYTGRHPRLLGHVPRGVFTRWVGEVRSGCSGETCLRIAERHGGADADAVLACETALAAVLDTAGPGLRPVLLCDLPGWARPSDDPARRLIQHLLGYTGATWSPRNPRFAVLPVPAAAAQWAATVHLDGVVPAPVGGDAADWLAALADNPAAVLLEDQRRRARRRRDHGDRAAIL